MAPLAPGNRQILALQTTFGFVTTTVVLGYKRPGVPFDFSRYFPEDFAPYFPLHVYLSEEYQRSTAGALRKRYKPMTDPAILDALEHAVEAFQE